MSKYIQKVERCSFLISRSVKCVTLTRKVDNFVKGERNNEIINTSLVSYNF
jgi:hypothetical protein